LPCFACSAVWTLSLGLSFERLVGMDILLYGTSLVLEFVALVALRMREPMLPGRSGIPGGVLATAALGLGPLGLLGFALVKKRRRAGRRVNALAFGSA